MTTEDDTQDTNSQDDNGASEESLEQTSAAAEETNTASEPEIETKPASEKIESGNTNAKSSSQVGNSEVNLESLLKVPVSLSIEVGRKQMRLDDLLETQEGSVIELDKLLNEPLDILVNGALIAHGVIVLAQERFGIQITDILSPEERARSL